MKDLGTKKTLILLYNQFLIELDDANRNKKFIFEETKEPTFELFMSWLERDHKTN